MKFDHPHLARALRGLLIFAAAASPARAEEPLSASMPSLTDPDFVWRADAPPIVLTGHIAPGLPEDVAISVSASLVTLEGARQRTLAAQFEVDGTFRFEIPGGLPVQELWLSVKPVYFGRILLCAGLHVDLDTQAMGHSIQYAGKGVTFSGPDGALNDAANRFILHERKRQLEIGKAGRDISRDRNGSFEESLARLVELRDERRAILERFDAGDAREFLAGEIECEFLADVLWLARTRQVPLERTGLLAALRGVRLHGPTNVQNRLLKGVGFLLESTPSGSLDPAVRLSEILPWIELRLTQPQFAAKAAEFRPLLEQMRNRVATEDVPQTADRELFEQLGKADLLDGQWFRFDRISRESIPLLPGSLADLVRMAILPEEPNARAECARRAIAEAAERWGAEYMRGCLTEGKAEQRRIAETLARAQALVPTGPVDALQPVATLPDCGATLYAVAETDPAALIAHLRALHPGKALLLDMWGTWCGACIGEVPAGKRAKKVLGEQPLAFVYLGARMTEGQWKAGIARHGLTGTHVLLNDAQSAALMQLLGGTGYPTYALIDAAGKRVDGAVRQWLLEDPSRIAQALTAGADGGGSGPE